MGGPLECAQAELACDARHECLTAAANGEHIGRLVRMRLERQALHQLAHGDARVECRHFQKRSARRIHCSPPARWRRRRTQSPQVTSVSYREININLLLFVIIKFVNKICTINSNSSYILVYFKISIRECECTNDAVEDGQKHQICLVLKFAI